MIPALLLAAALAAGPTPGGRPMRECIPVNAGSTTQYTPVDDHTIVVRSLGRWWRLTTNPSSLLGSPFAYFINEIRGASVLCDRLDFDLTVADRAGGVRMPLIVQSFDTITPDEGKALLARPAKR